MATKKKAAPTEVKKDEVEVAAPVAAKETSKGEEDVTAYDVLKGDQYIRQYNLELQGEDFKALAKEFVDKKNSDPRRSKGDYVMVPAGEVGKVEVRYREKQDAELHIDKQKPDAPMVDKVRVFDDKQAAVAFKNSKFGATCVISKKGIEKNK